MSEMVERVARAISEADGAPWEHMSDAHKRGTREAARAAIEAMREPTPAVREQLAAWSANDPGDITGSANLDEMWAALIDAALQPYPIRSR